MKWKHLVCASPVLLETALVLSEHLICLLFQCALNDPAKHVSWYAMPLKLSSYAHFICRGMTSCFRQSEPSQSVIYCVPAVSMQWVLPRVSASPLWFHFLLVSCYSYTGFPYLSSVGTHTSFLFSIMLLTAWPQSPSTPCRYPTQGTLCDFSWYNSDAFKMLLPPLHFVLCPHYSFLTIGCLQGWVCLGSLAHLQNFKSFNKDPLLPRFTVIWNNHCGAGLVWSMCLARVSCKLVPDLIIALTCKLYGVVSMYPLSSGSQPDWNGAWCLSQMLCKAQQTSCQTHTGSVNEHCHPLFSSAPSIDQMPAPPLSLFSSGCSYNGVCMQVCNNK